MDIQRKRLRIISWALAIGVLITILKFIAYFITKSTAIYTDALENIINIITGAIAFFSIYFAARPKDENHPYGHGKVEFFAVGFEGALIVFASLSIIYKAVYAIIYPQEINFILQGISFTIIAGLANFFLGKYLVRSSKPLKSITLEADGKHLLSDAYTSIGLVAGLIIIKFTGLIILDSLISIVLGLIILYNGYHLIRKSVSGLMDEVDPELVDSIVSILNKSRKDSWIDIHNLRAQKYGADLHIDCHITLPYYYNLLEMHEEVKEVEVLIERESETKVELFIHVDPCLPNCCFYCSMPQCNVRSTPCTVHIPWTTENVIKNAKHFNSHV